VRGWGFTHQNQRVYARLDRSHGQTDRQAAARKTWAFIHGGGEASGPQRATPGLGEPSEREKMQLVEAVLFVARDSLSSRKLAQLAGLADATEARTLVRLLNQRYDSAGRVFRVEEVAGGYCLLTRPQFAPWLRRLRHVPGEIRLTQSAMETLAIVAYRQPVPRADIEAIRGVSCGEILKQLMQRDLVRICGRSEDLGRPYLYGTTRFFLQMFGLRSADRLPRSDWVNGTRDISQPTQVITSASSSDQDSGTGTDAKESTVRKSFSTSMLIQQSNDDADEMLLNVHDLRAVDDDDDDFFDDDDDDADDDDDDAEEFEDDDFEDDDDEEEDAEEDALEDDEEAFDDDDEEEESDWEEVDDEEGEGDEEEDDDWDDDEDDDWDDEDGEDDEEEWD
jgi:segregation and condensation protein B